MSPRTSDDPVKVVSKPKVLIVCANHHFPLVFGEDIAQRLSWLVEALPIWRTEVGGTTWPDSLAEADFILGSWGTPPLTDHDLDRAPNLKGIFYGAGTTKGLVGEQFWQREIVLSSAAAANAIPVAEYCLAMTLLSLKKVPQSIHPNRMAKRWLHYPFTQPPKGAYGSMVGLISLGLTARAFLKLLDQTDLRRIAWSPELNVRLAKQLKLEARTLEEVFQQADVVSVHSPLLPSTKGYITGDHIHLMQPGATLLNSSRGQILDQASVLQALRERPDVHAILDVTDPEPPKQGDALFELPNVTTTTHVSGSLGMERRRCGDFAILELERFLNAEPLVGAVKRENLAVSA